MANSLLSQSLVEFDLNIWIVHARAHFSCGHGAHNKLIKKAHIVSHDIMS